MTVRIKVWSDYVCPFCLLAGQPLAEATAGRDVSVDWMPFELRPEPVPTLRPEGDYLRGIWSRVVYPMARSMGVGIRLPDVSPQPYTRLAFEGYQFAKEHDLAGAYHDRVLRAFFEDGLDIGDLDVLERLAGEAGLSATDYRAALEGGRYARAHRAALAEAAAHRITAVPTILVEDIRIEGMPTRAGLHEAIDRAAARQGDRLASGAACSIDGC
ncbi:putative DsbA family dithiol-disulfide isomerase [Nonomuraea thailandensis]|uniref:DsbA family dithiol-disulfide isomerase n=1 Tax=Nonomuraea thailandensis TaxID=1188745 RepID=A0A9X2GHK5_9ACTN|nr:DsbA family protein [Nonomuraea thailandensis]MCP2354858.1 putative DsbA family dithiol-disulfide isomerase [Nonomuraea thailandensis]